MGDFANIFFFFFAKRPILSKILRPIRRGSVARYRLRQKNILLTAQGRTQQLQNNSAFSRGISRCATTKWATSWLMLRSQQRHKIPGLRGLLERGLPRYRRAARQASQRSRLMTTRMAHIQSLKAHHQQKNPIPHALAHICVIFPPNGLAERDGLIRKEMAELQYWHERPE